MTEYHRSILSAAEQLMHSTIRIECLLNDGSFSTGTGFHFRFTVDGETVPTIITNKHVLEGAVQLNLHFTLADTTGRSTGKHTPWAIREFSPAVWYGHRDASVDLAL